MILFGGEKKEIKTVVIPIVINICAYLIKSEIRISKSETSTNDQNSNDKSCVSRLSSIVLRGYGGRAGSKEENYREALDT
jgi:uncharacterized alpha/beta hydrolase family protein